MTFPYGNNIKIYIDGGSHDEKISVRMENFPSGERVDFAQLKAFLLRRAPGQGAYSTARREPDEPVFLSGFAGEVTDGTPICAAIYNRDAHSSDYSFADTPRPSHADYAALMKYGSGVDLRGGGHFSGRLTAPLCIAGAICLQYLKRHGIEVFSHIYSIGDVFDSPFNPMTVGMNEKNELEKCSGLRVLDSAAGEKMLALIAGVKSDGDSVGGIVETAVIGLPAGLGEHMFAGVEARISSAVFGIPAVKGIEFGAGFSCAALRGSQNNDPFVTDGKTVRTKTNNSGGILGGMTDGMPLVFRAAVKPTPSIAKEQDSVSLSKMENVKIRIGGRHDPCIVPRAVPAFEAATAIAVCDMLLDKNNEE